MQILGHKELNHCCAILHVSGLRVCFFLGLPVRMRVAGANKVEGTMSSWFICVHALAHLEPVAICCKKRT